MVVAFVGYIIAYNTYGRFLARKIFKLSDEACCPSKELQDGIDYVPTRKILIFGHHFASIAGTGPIVGPAIGIIWGWLPAMLWIFVGSIFMGAVHDLGALALSLRNQGKSISEITVKYIGSRVRYIFFLVVFFELLIVIAIFGMVIAVIFSIFPASVLAVWMQIPIAMTLGVIIYRRGGNVTLYTILAVTAMYMTIALGHFLPFQMPAIAGIPPTGVWTIILLVYCYFASTLPVTMLLQPRDYINAWQLLIAMLLLMLGAFASGFVSNLEIVAPAVNLHVEGAPPLFPFLFITIACGAISGFHALVSSGTSAKQVAREPDALFVGYGSMLTEAALATLVIIAVAAGIGMAYKTGDGNILTGIAAWQAHYSSWGASSGMGANINAVVVGAANMMATIGIPAMLGIIIIGVFIASFAGTTLDTATRIQRYIVGELFSDVRMKFMTNKYIATAFAVIAAALLAFATGADGKGALTLWPMFGAVNQLLAALALIVITIYLKRRRGIAYLVAIIPCLFMLVMTIWGAILNETEYVAKGNWLLLIINAIVLLLACWMILESIIVFVRRGNSGAS